MDSGRDGHHSVERSAIALEISGDGVWELSALDPREPLDPGAAAVYSPRFIEMLGYGELAPVLESWREAIHHHDQERHGRSLIDAMERRSPRVEIEYRVTTRQGEVRWWHEMSRAMPSSQTGRARVIGIVRDITEQKRIQEILKRDTDLLRQTQSAARVGGWELDIEHQRLSWTPETYAIHEVPEGFVPELNTALNFYAPEAVPTITAAVDACIKGKPYDVMLDLITYTGKRINVHAAGRPHIENGKVLRLFGSFRDISEQVRREAELRAQVALIAEQQSAIRALSTPIIRVWDGIITLPLIGTIDAQRAAQIMENLLAEVVRIGAQYAILDLTGVEVVDPMTAEQLFRISRAVALLGATALFCGLTPPVAQAMTELDLDTTQFVSYRNLQEALRTCIRGLARPARR
jgi:rsbT co-antagonist protein RsbR